MSCPFIGGRNIPGARRNRRFGLGVGPRTATGSLSVLARTRLREFASVRRVMHHHIRIRNEWIGFGAEAIDAAVERICAGHEVNGWFGVEKVQHLLEGVIVKGEIVYRTRGRFW